jgi:hypothetical protein
MLPDLLLYPAFDQVKTRTRMSDPKVVHPTAQDRIDFRNHHLHRPADVLSEDLPELFEQRRPLLQLVLAATLSATKSATLFATEETNARYYRWLKDWRAI